MYGFLDKVTSAVVYIYDLGLCHITTYNPSPRPDITCEELSLSVRKRT